jgi:hypothetical protein
MAVLRFATNQPQQVCLTSLEPETVSSQFGSDQMRFRSQQGDIYVSPAVGKIFAEAIAAQQIQAGDWVQISKSEAALGNGRKGIRWELRRLTAPAAGEQGDGTFAIPAPPAAPAVERKPAASEFASRLAMETNAIIDAFSMSLDHAMKRQIPIRPEDVRSILLSVYIGAQKGSRNAAA